MRHHTLGTRIHQHCKHNLIYLITLIIIWAGPLPAAQAASFQSDEVSWRQTVSIYHNIPGLTSQQIEYGETAIRAMHYNAQRVFRKICAMQGVNFEYARQALELLNQDRLSFEQVLSFEALSNQGPLDIRLGLSGITAVRSLNYQAGKSFRSYLGVEGISPLQALSTIPMFNNMSDANNRAAQGFFAVNGMNMNVTLKGLPMILRLKNNHAKAAEAFAKTKGMNTETMLDGLELILKLRQDDAWNARCLFLDKTLSSTEAWNWLVSYFALPSDIQENQYDKLDSRQKSMLLKGLYDGGSEIIWRINNLHAVTDDHGYEISEAALSRYSMKQLQDKFEQLAPQVKSRFGAQFYAAGRAQAIGLLRQATSAARVQTARNLSTANAYAVMAQGSELYDSSFRDILVPVLQSRITSKAQGDLLRFLRAIDPENRLVSDFIVSCAQKGKLTAFFPVDGGKQKEILHLVADSAFRNEDSILLFSATFNHLLSVLEPDARSYLITLMASKSEAKGMAFSKLINVILQYFLQTYPELLGPADRLLISRLIVHNGAVNLEKYQVTPFGEWKSDGRLASVSMFHPDDDGRQSFVSNANLLLKSGYRLVPSKQYTIGSLTPSFAQEIQRWSSSGLPALFQAMRSRHFAIAFVKQVGAITIVHTQFVYSDEDNQMEMLKRFVRSGDEMLAQRGHSYWRSEQIVEPLTQLIKDNKITDYDLRGKQRFLSLGSCGGVKVYTQLTRLFEGSVDILATIGTGLSLINDPYNKIFFEIIASNPSSLSWKGVAQQSSSIFQGGRGQDYLQPGSLTAILHKILDETRFAEGSVSDNRPRG